MSATTPVSAATSPLVSPWQAPWYATPAHATPQHAMVLGAGIAGAAVAFSLARRGIRVTVFERGATVAGGASGNAQGVLHTKLSPHATPLTQLLVQGYAYSRALLPQTLGAPGQDWDDCGILQLSVDAEEARRHAGLAACDWTAGWLRSVSAAEGSALSGIPQVHAGLWFEGGGWVHPPAWVRALLAHPLITVCCEAEAVSLTHLAAGDWQLTFADGRHATAPVVVVATAHEAAHLPVLAHLPLSGIRGQTAVVAATAGSRALKSVVCGGSYVSPARQDGSHCFGATFRFQQTTCTVTDEEHEENLAKLAVLAPPLYQALGGAALRPAQLLGRSAFRATTPDYLPLVGGVAEAALFAPTYPAPEQVERQQLTTPAPWLSGLYVSLGHGSRGLVTAPLAGEVLGAAIAGEPSPLSAALLAAVHPNRFLLRGQKRRHAPAKGAAGGAHSGKP